MSDEKPPEKTTPSDAAKKLAATIVKRTEQMLRDAGMNASVNPVALDELIEIYLEKAREEGRRAGVENAADLEATFDLRWKADMRAIARWRSEAPGRELKQPDHADMVVWLLDKLEAAGVRI